MPTALPGSVDAPSAPPLSVPAPDEAAMRRRETAAFAARLKVLRRDHRNVALPGLLAAYLGVVALLLAPLWLSPWHLVWMIPLMGILQYRIVISGHEAVHHTLAWPRPLNEGLGVFGQAIVGVNFAAYRIQHLDHHKVRTRAEDPDGHIYGWVIEARPGLPRLAVLVFGTFIEIIIKVYQKGTGGIGNNESHPPAVEAAKRRHTAYVVAAQLSLIAITWATTGWFFGYLVLWIAPLFGVAVFLNRCRIVVEHGLAHLIAQRMPEGFQSFGGLRIPTVDIVPNPIEGWIFAPFRFNYHCCHHLFMTVPHYNLPALRELLREQQYSGYHEVHGSYLSALSRCIWDGDTAKPARPD